MIGRFQNLKYLYAPDMARVFNGSSRFLSSPATGMASYPLTMACWFYATNVTSDGCLMSVVDSTGADHLSIDVYGSTAGDPLGIEARNDATVEQDSTDSTTGFVATRFTHACGVFESATRRSIYCNGGGKATSTLSVTCPAIDKAGVGVHPSAGNFGFFNGRVAWPFYWKAALTDAEVLALAMGLPPWLMRPERIVSAPLMLELFDPFQGAKWTNTAGALVVAPHKLRLVTPTRYKPGMAVAAAGGTLFSNWHRRLRGRAA